MRRGICVLVLFAILLSLFSCRSESDGFETSLEIICLDVGQGACLLLRTPSGDVLVDAASEATQASVIHRLKSLGVTSVKCLILTHSDEDHIGGADAILREFSVESLWVSGEWGSSEAVDRLWDAARSVNLSVDAVHSGALLRLGDTVLTVLSPSADRVEEENEGSIVLSVQYAGFSMLLMGDAGVPTEQWLLNTYTEAHLRATILGVAHHGSNSSCGEDFLQTVRPEAALISCGVQNQYGHPDGRTLARLSAVGAEILRTDLSGDIRIEVDAGGAWRIC